MSADDVGVNYPIPRSVHTDAKVAASLIGVSLKQFIISAMQERAAKVLAERDKEPSKYRRLGHLSGYAPGK